jgi:ribosomal protein S12 methylthiotransferase
LVISQDTSAYGVDIKYAPSTWKDAQVSARFLDLSRALGDLGAWVRLHYVYPYPHVDDVIPLMAEGKVLPYLDIPFQHGSPAVLKRMKRPGVVEKTLGRIKAWREVCPDLTIRSTFIVGFPGETEAEFEELLAWLDEAQLDRVGAFKYSPVEGAAANDIAEHVDPKVQEDRLARFMQRAAGISAARLAAKVGRRMEVLVDAVDKNVAIARSVADAPEIDGVVKIAKGGKLEVGEFVDVEITGSGDHDLEAKVVTPRA